MCTLFPKEAHSLKNVEAPSHLARVIDGVN
jgi:hypothetical protein